MVSKSPNLSYLIFLIYKTQEHSKHYLCSCVSQAMKLQKISLACAESQDIVQSVHGNLEGENNRYCEHLFTFEKGKLLGFFECVKVEFRLKGTLCLPGPS